MAKVIGLSGPQGGGKTTLLNGLKHEDVIVDDFKVSRQVQKELGWDSLANVMESPETMMKFQAKVRDVKYVRELENRGRQDAAIILTERTFADIAAYTRLWSWKLVEEDKWHIRDALDYLIEFVGLCQNDQLVYHGNLLLPQMPHVLFEKDPHRADESQIEFITTQLDRFFDTIHPRHIPVFRITEKSVDDRIKQVNNWLHQLRVRS